MYEQLLAIEPQMVDDVMGLREAVILFGGLSIVQGIGAVIARINGWLITAATCPIPFIYAAAGIMGAPRGDRQRRLGQNRHRQPGEHGRCVAGRTDQAQS